jgi:hypothetical protein
MKPTIRDKLNMGDYLFHPAWSQERLFPDYLLSGMSTLQMAIYFYAVLKHSNCSFFSAMICDKSWSWLGDGIHETETHKNFLMAGRCGSAGPSWPLVWHVRVSLVSATGVSLDRVKRRVADRVQFCARSGPPVQQPPRTGTGPVERLKKHPSKRGRSSSISCYYLLRTYTYVDVCGVGSSA